MTQPNLTITHSTPRRCLAIGRSMHSDKQWSPEFINGFGYALMQYKINNEQYCLFIPDNYDSAIDEVEQIPIGWVGFPCVVPFRIVPNRHAPNTH